jgi:hypothetical protein
MRTRRVALALALSAALAHSPALAQSDADRNQARLLGQEGQAALDAKDYKTAEDKFRRAYTLYPSAPTLALGLARALAGTGRFVAAEETYNKIVRDGAPPGNVVFVKAVEDAKAELAQVSAKISYATLNVTGPETARVTLDGQPLAWAALGAKRPVDPGEHTLAANADGYAPAETRFKIDAGKETTVNLTLQKDTGAAPPSTSPVTPPAAGGTAPPPPPPGANSAQLSAERSSQKTLAFVAFGAGGLGLVVGGITGILSIGKHGDLKNACTTNGQCPPDQKDALDSYHAMGTISTIGFVAAGVGAAAGAVLLFTAPKAAARAYVSPYVGLGSVGATGVF